MMEDLETVIAKKVVKDRVKFPLLKSERGAHNEC